MHSLPANNLSMWWRRRIVSTAKPSPFSREAGALEQLIATTDNTAVAELAKIRLRVVRFLSNQHERSADGFQAADQSSPTDAEVAAARRDLPRTHTPVPAAHLVDIRAKAKALDQLSTLNVDRYSRSRELLASAGPTRTLDDYAVTVLAVVAALIAILLILPAVGSRLLAVSDPDVTQFERTIRVLVLGSLLAIGGRVFWIWWSTPRAAGHPSAQHQLWYDVERVTIATTDKGVDVVVFRRRGRSRRMSYHAMNTTPDELALTVALEIDHRRPFVSIVLNGEPWCIEEALEADRSEA